MRVLFLTTDQATRRSAVRTAASAAIIDHMSRLGAEVTVLRGAHAGNKPRRAAFVAQIRALLNIASFEVAIVDHAALAWVADTLPDGVRVVALLHGIEHEIEQPSSQSARPWCSWLCRRQARQLERLEVRLAQRADEIWSFNGHDAAHFARVSGGRPSRVLPLSGRANPAAAATCRRYDVALLSDWTSQTGADALHWFLSQIYPKLPAHITIRVAGKGGEWLEGCFPNVAYQSFAGNAQKFFAHARAAAIPALRGAAMQVDVLTALSVGTRVVATPCALRGLSPLPAAVFAAGLSATFARQLTEAIIAPDADTARIEAVRWTSERTRRCSMELAAGLRIAAPALAPQYRGEPRSIRTNSLHAT